ncbi:hypothetical protein [Sphingopyxis sp.]|uniref:hypothetical protein n=1 Tax=Sphingopyxis sp. TaxID=1908224 RepID=UPI002B48F8CA|nr:hypothetical protein [Sphingopyxis sp.]HJS09697.1 hypothetical protein [Sphingopyxis sp.]
MPDKSWTALIALALAAPPALAQDLPTDLLERHADVVRQDMLLKSTLRHSRAHQKESAAQATPRQKAACAKKAEFRGQYGADHPKVRKLHGLCRNIGL